jgi:hypothetical protein
MESQERRNNIVKLLGSREEAISGTDLAKYFGVTRQVIVKDIALLRAQNNKILSTSRGYLLYNDVNMRPRRAMAVKHSRENIKDELFTIIDLGGTILDVIVEHPIYEEITVNLILKSRRDVEDFLHQLNEHQTIPLMHLTGGEHYHTVEADNEHILDEIEKELNIKGYLIK